MVTWPPGQEDFTCCEDRLDVAMVPAAITTDAFARPNSSEFDTRVIIALGFPSWDCVQAFSGIVIRSVFSVKKLLQQIETFMITRIHRFYLL